MGVADAVATVAGHILARLRDDLTPAQETVLRRALTAEAERIDPARKNGAPGWTPGTPPTAAPLGGDTAMDSIPRQAQQLRPDDIITRHPDHPNREVWYRVDGWPRRVSHAQMLVNYTCRPARISGDSAGVLILDIDQECQVVPAHTQGGAA